MRLPFFFIYMLYTIYVSVSVVVLVVVTGLLPLLSVSTTVIGKLYTVPLLLIVVVNSPKVITVDLLTLACDAVVILEASFELDVMLRACALDIVVVSPAKAVLLVVPNTMLALAVLAVMAFA